MEFTIVCPVDGEMTVGLESVENMVVHEKGRADITFRCPHCGTQITISAAVPAFLISAMEGISKDLGIPMENGRIVFNAFGQQGEGAGSVPQFVGVDPLADAAQTRELSTDERAHLEYFRRELDGVRTVDDFLQACD